MKAAVIAIALCGATSACAAYASPGPSGPASTRPLPPPRDQPYPGTLQVNVDATDIARRIVHVHEVLSGVTPDTILLYPMWLPGTHAPEGPLDRLAGIRITAGGVSVPWTRDPVKVGAFRVRIGPGVKSLEIDFDYLSPTSEDVGAMEISRELMMLEWNELVLYPAGYFARQIPVDATLTIPAQWSMATALETQGSDGARTVFKRVPLNTLIDSPVYAGRYSVRIDLDPHGPAAVHLNVFADRPEYLKMKPEQIEAHKALVQQAYKLFDSHHYAHYDFLYSLSDQIQATGLEHHQSSENGSDPETFTKWDQTAWTRDLLAHEYTHSWNGKFRRPADLWTPDYNVPMQDSLLWVYEGQTQYWGQVLAARSGLRTRAQAMDQLALTAAYYQQHHGSKWRPLQDTTNDEIINPRRPQSWTDWQRFEDYYEEGALIWLEADTLIRERSQGKRSLDDFAREFFGIDNGSFVTVTYTFDDVVRALNSIEPYDWKSFLRERLDAVGSAPPLQGLSRGGYKLIYTDTPSDYMAATEEQRQRVDLRFSIGIELDDKDRGKSGTVFQVMWDSPAFKAQLTAGAQILAVNGIAYSADVLKDAIRAAHDSSAPIELIVKTGDRYSVAKLDYHDGLRYPHLERDTTQPARLDEILTPRP